MRAAAAQRCTGRVDHPAATTGGRRADPLTRAKVIEKAKKIFPNLDIDVVLAELDRYGVESYERERDRVQLAILKLSQEERLPSPAHYVEAAKRDYRDVLAWAEYPGQIMVLPGDLSPEEHRLLGRADLEQYEAWLNG